jgi:AcrR family transcriptional regulator
MPSVADPAKPGLRERKKAQTRAAIQTHALRLFREQGYQATTIEQIITAADISESTLFRYFPTKEDLVLADDYDPLIIDALRAQPPDVAPIPAIRAALASVFGEMSEDERVEQRERVALVLSVPALRARMLDQFLQAVRIVGEVIAERTKRRADDFAVRTVAGAVIGAFLAGLDTVAEQPDADLGTLIDQALENLQHGLTL